MGCERWGWCGRGGVWARIGSLLPSKCKLGVGTAFKYSLFLASQVCVVVVRARGGVGTHWQPLNTL